MGTPTTAPVELNELLEGLEELPLTGGQRTSVIDWDSLRSALVKRSWFQVGAVCDELEKDLAKRKITKPNGEPKEVHYSQVHGFIMRTAKKGKVPVRKKKIDDGPFRGTYYIFDSPGK